MHRLLAWLFIGTFALSACASGAPVPLETETDSSKPERLPEVLSSCKPGDRIEVWAKSGECFEATFVSYEASTLTVDNKTYRRTYHQDNRRHRAQMEYTIEEIARLRVNPPPEETYSPQLSPIGVAAVAIMTVAVVGTILFALAFRDVRF
jgi:hypothetical protein